MTIFVTIIQYSNVHTTSSIIGIWHFFGSTYIHIYVTCTNIWWWVFSSIGLYDLISKWSEHYLKPLDDRPIIRHEWESPRTKFGLLKTLFSFIIFVAFDFSLYCFHWIQWSKRGALWCRQDLSLKCSAWKSFVLVSTGS